MEPDPQELLPPDLRRTWAAVPRATLYQVCLVGAILGAGTALSVAGLIVGSNPMYYGFPVAVVLAKLQNWAFPWERKAISELRLHQSQNTPAATQVAEVARDV
ncbi:MAG: hypothetical protein RIB58_04910 [Phycisphaerales bacterium]